MSHPVGSVGWVDSGCCYVDWEAAVDWREILGSVLACSDWGNRPGWRGRKP